MGMDEQFDRIDASIKVQGRLFESSLKEQGQHFESALKEQGRLFENLFDSLKSEMHQEFGEVKARLDRADATLVQHGKQLAGGARALAGFNEWVGKADADYTRVLAELSELKRRIEKLERPAA